MKNSNDISKLLTPGLRVELAGKKAIKIKQSALSKISTGWKNALNMAKVKADSIKTGFNDFKDEKVQNFSDFKDTSAEKVNSIKEEANNGIDSAKENVTSFISDKKEAFNDIFKEEIAAELDARNKNIENSYNSKTDEIKKAAKAVYKDESMPEEYKEVYYKGVNQKLLKFKHNKAKKLNAGLGIFSLAKVAVNKLKKNAGDKQKQEKIIEKQETEKNEFKEKMLRLQTLAEEQKKAEERERQRLEEIAVLRTELGMDKNFIGPREENIEFESDIQNSGALLAK